MRIWGFGKDDRQDTNAVQEPQTEACETPVESLVSVRFDGVGRDLTYFNDSFDLKAGDRVFVSGKLEDKVGCVTAVSRKFRIRRSDYECVIALAQTPVRGTYRPLADKMLSYDADALSPEAFRTWILPPEEPLLDPEDEIIYGEGYAIPLDDPHGAEEVDEKVFERAITYCSEQKIGYVSVRNGVGRAFVEGNDWYEIEFCLRDNAIAEAYCSCPYPGLCKHLLAVAVTLSVFAKNGDLDLGRDFVLIDANRFYGMIRQNNQTIRV